MHLTFVTALLATFSATMVGAQMDLAPWDVLTCAARAQVTCDRTIWPFGTTAGQCIDVYKIAFYDPTSKIRTKCFCEAKALQQQWWDCFYQGVTKCPDQQNMMEAIWWQEWRYHRYLRRLHCLDDYKPNPPWDKIDNAYMKQHYNLSQEIQYSNNYVEDVPLPAEVGVNSTSLPRIHFSHTRYRNLENGDKFAQLYEE